MGFNWLSLKHVKQMLKIFQKYSFFRRLEFRYSLADVLINDIM